MNRQNKYSPTQAPPCRHRTDASPRKSSHRAVTALESKREEATKDLKGTVSIGATAQELELEATPEEIWAEVQAQRRRTETIAPDIIVPPISTPPESAPPAASAPATPPLHQAVATSLRDAAVAAAPGLRDAASAARPALQNGIHAVSDYVAQQKQIRKDNSSKKRQGRELSAAFGVIGLALFIAFNHGHDAINIPSSNPPSIQTLAEVPEGQTVWVDTADLEAIEHGSSPTTQLVHDEKMDNGWRLVKHDGQLYVRGFTLPLSDQALSIAPVKMYNDDNAGVLEGVDDSEVTLPLSGFHIDSTQKSDDWSELDISHVRTNKYSREDW